MGFLRKKRVLLHDSHRRVFSQAENGKTRKKGEFAENPRLPASLPAALCALPPAAFLCGVAGVGGL
jgi:hypothetical protein